MAYVFTRPRDPTDVLGRRFAAFLIDAAVIVLIGVTLVASAKHTSYYGAPPGACSHVNPPGTTSMCFQVNDHLYVWNRGAFFRSELLSVFVGFVDLVVLQALTGASIGKLCVGLRVVDAQGRRAGWARMFGRWVFLLVDLGCLLIGLITVLATHPHRRVGDLVCGTFVVGTRSVGRPIDPSAPGGSGYGASEPGARPGPEPGPRAEEPPDAVTAAPGPGAPPEWENAPPPLPADACAPAEQPQLTPPTTKWSAAVTVFPAGSAEASSPQLRPNADVRHDWEPAVKRPDGESETR